MKEIEELMARVLAGDCDGQEVERFAALLREDGELRRRFARLARVEGQLGVVLEDELGRERWCRSVMDAVEREDSERFVTGVQGRLVRRRWFLRVAAAAAVVVLTGVWSRQFAGRRPEREVATVSRLESVEWGGGPVLEEGGRLVAGDRLGFEAGLAEVVFGDRGRMVLEGPAELEFVDAMRVILRRGRMVMRVTEAGHGFRLETPQGSVIDHGTEFGVSVGDDGVVETHVLEGRVESVAGGGDRVMLKEDDALRLGPVGSERIEMDAGGFYTSVPPRRSGPLRFIRWSLDEDRGLLARAEVHGLGSGPAEMVFHAIDEGSAPAWVDGVHGAALSFDGKGSYAESGFPGIGGGEARTVAFWVKVPTDFSIREGFGILSWGQHRNEGLGEVWQVSVNPLVRDGPVGRLRVGLHGAQVVGSSDLRDGEWHHVAVVLYGGSRPDVGTHVMLYIDGEMESISRRALGEVRTEVERAQHGVWIGRNITYTDPSMNHHHGGFFRGEIDELFIVAGALSHDEIRRVMSGNSL